MTTLVPDLDTEVVEHASASPTLMGCCDAGDIGNGDAGAPLASWATPIPHVLQNSPLSPDPEHLARPAGGITATSILRLTSPVRCDMSDGEAERLQWLSMPTTRPLSSPSVLTPLQASAPPSLEASWHKRLPCEGHWPWIAQASCDTCMPKTATYQRVVS